MKRPSTPLPWKVADGHFQHVTKEDIAYLVHAANAYPGLIKALWHCRNETDDTHIHAFIDGALGELGEI